LEDRGGQDDKVSGRMWETVETGAREIRVGKTEGRRSKGGKRGKKRKERKEEKPEEEEDGRS